jgi:alkylation response protein AidB-like acyl-CoA dehydrogenase
VTRVALSEEQVMLASTAAQLVVDHPTLVDPGLERTPVEAKLWASLVDCGFIELARPRAHHGAGGTTLDASLVIEQLARGLSAAPYLGTMLALDLMVAVASDGEELGEILAGRPGCVVLDSTLTSPASVGIGVDGGPEALAVGIEGGVVCISELASPLDAIDLSRALFRVEAAGKQLGAISAGDSLRWQALALALTCADIVGAMTGALEACVAHARHRQQFGRPVGSFQAVQQLCADQLVTVESCRSITWRAAWAVDALEPAEALAVSRVAKAHCSEAGRTVCEAAIQVWGGLGMTWDCPAHRYLRRALLDRQLFGDEWVQLAAIADERLGPMTKASR